MKPAIIHSRQEMSSPRNLLLHGLYLSLFGLFKYCSVPGMNLPRLWILRLFGASIESRMIADGVTIWFPWRVKIGRRSTVNQGVLIDGTGGVRIGEGVRIAPYACIHSCDHDFRDPSVMIADQGFLLGQITIEDDVWIGAGAQITRGVIIGRSAVIGAGAVVTRDVPAYAVVAGVPARVVRYRTSGR